VIKNSIIKFLVVSVLFTPIAFSKGWLQKILNDDAQEKQHSTQEERIMKESTNSGLDATEHDNGYTWAEQNRPETEDDCAQGGFSFDNGCYDWLDENR